MVGRGWVGVVRSGTGGDGVGASGLEAKKLRPIPGPESIVEGWECISQQRIGRGKSRKHGWKLGMGKGRREKGKKRSLGRSYLRRCGRAKTA